jgi:hypothetical protein
VEEHDGGQPEPISQAPHVSPPDNGRASGTPPDVALPLEEHLAEMFNQAEDERRIHHAEAEQRRDGLAMEAEGRRHEEFIAREDERQRIFEEGEKKRNDTCEAIRQEIFDVKEEERRAISQAAEDDRQTIGSHAESKRAASIRTAIDAAAESHVESICTVIQTEKDEMERQRAEFEEERARLLQKKEDDKAQLKADYATKILALQEELVTLRETTEAFKTEREAEEIQRREQQKVELEQRDEALRNQLSDITMLLQAKKARCDELQATHDRRISEKEERRVKKEADLINLNDLVRRITEAHDEEKDLLVATKEHQATKPSELRCVHIVSLV